MKKSVLVIGGGGREHAIVASLSASDQVGRIYCAPGNAGIAHIAECIPIKDTDIEGLKSFAKDHSIDLTVVGPEAALEKGIVDSFRQEGLRIFGHTADAARIETSKEFAKELMVRHGIPTASYRSFEDYDDALDYVSSRSFPTVLKYDGLAAGKGVVIAADPAEAESALSSMLRDARFGRGRVVVEDFLEGPEFSFMCFVSGEKVYPMPLSQDHKRAFDGDEGPNTGGMGAYTGLDFLSDEDKAFALHNIMEPAARAMSAEGTPLSGVLYGGLMKTAEGIKVIEFNARFGDPETEVVLPLLKSDIYAIFEAVACGTEVPVPEWEDAVTVGVVMASKGYPGSYSKGYGISGLESVRGTVYHMGTAMNDGQTITSGGRVLMCVAKAADITEARLHAYEDIDRISCDNLFYRSDIAHWSARVIDGKAVSSDLKDALKARMPELEARYGRKPCLAVIIVGSDPASQSYVRGKVKAAGYVGMDSRLIELPEDTTQDALMSQVHELNADPVVDGILVQLPLPAHLSEKAVIESILPEKDVDGFHPDNVAALWLGNQCLLPCTPKGIMTLLSRTGVSLDGKSAVIVGRSNIVGKPMAKLLLDANCTVTIAHTHTRNLKSVTLGADILIAAAGRRGLISGDMVKPGAVVIDVGVNRGEDGKLYGDVDFLSALSRASWITPVPGGVGPMTITMLMENTVECFLARVKS